IDQDRLRRGRPSEAHVDDANAELVKLCERDRDRRVIEDTVVADVNSDHMRSATESSHANAVVDVGRNHRGDGSAMTDVVVSLGQGNRGDGAVRGDVPEPVDLAGQIGHLVDSRVDEPDDNRWGADTELEGPIDE